MRIFGLLFVAVIAVAGLIVSTASGTTTPTVVYDSTVSPLPGNIPSEGPEAYSFREFGDEVTFAGTQRTLAGVSVTLSSWACQSGHWNTKDCSTIPGTKYSVPITLDIYEPASTAAPGTDPIGVGDLIARVRKTFQIPYRPSANYTHCTGAQAGEWYKSGVGCFNGKAVNITFNFTSLGMRLPNTVVLGVSYNTTHYGPHPIGESAPCFTSDGGCPYDSLNIGLAPETNVGSKPYPDTVFQDAAAQGDYCDGTPTPNTFNLDSPTDACWGGYVPAFKVTAR